MNIFINKDDNIIICIILFYIIYLYCMHASLQFPPQSQQPCSILHYLWIMTMVPWPWCWYHGAVAMVQWPWFRSYGVVTMVQWPWCSGH